MRLSQLPPPSYARRAFAETLFPQLQTGQGAPIIPARPICRLPGHMPYSSFCQCASENCGWSVPLAFLPF